MDEYLVSSDLDVWPPSGFLPFVPERAAVASTAPSAQRAARPVLHAHRLLRAAPFSVGSVLLRPGWVICGGGPFV